MRVQIALEPHADGGTRLTYQTWARPRNPIGILGIFIVIGLFSKTRFESVFRSYDRLASKGGSLAEIASRRGLSTAGRARFRSLSAPLIKDGTDAALIQRLEEFLNHADDLSLQRIRPYTLADRWAMPRRSVLELFLRSTRAGILDMFWDLLCPSCRGTTETSAHLSAVHSALHCNTCNIDFTANFDHNVEVVFRPNPSVRPIDMTLEFCVGSPQRQPHVILFKLFGRVKSWRSIRNFKRDVIFCALRVFPDHAAWSRLKKANPLLKPELRMMAGLMVKRMFH